MPRPCRSPAMLCRYGFRMCLSHLIYTVRPCLIHTCHAMPMLCSDRAVLLKATAQHVRRESACWLHARFRILPATTRSSTKVVIRHIPVCCRWSVWHQTPFVKDDENSGSSTLQKKKTICYTVGLAVRIFPATMRTFTMDTARSGQGRGMASVN